jgi:hypothetical protein
VKRNLVVTTINPPTDALQNSVSLGLEVDCQTIIVGDNKTPENFYLSGAEFLGIGEQSRLGFRIADSLPTATYSRKMIGYLHSLASGADLIYETDDDNKLYREFFDETLISTVARIAAKSGFINHYEFFTPEKIWPRGLPLDEIAASSKQQEPSTRDGLNGDMYKGRFGLVQGIADGNPDVDAVFRLSRADFDYIGFRFDSAEPLAVLGSSNSWLPLNSQVTIWQREFAALMYLPVTCSFRMTDIWRGYIAQRVFHEREIAVLLPGPMAFQDRNDHDLMRDFADEVEGYLGYRAFVQVLESVELGGLTLEDQLEKCYRELVVAGFFRQSELQHLEAWIADVQTV